MAGSRVTSFSSSALALLWSATLLPTHCPFPLTRPASRSLVTNSAYFLQTSGFLSSQGFPAVELVSLEGVSPAQFCCPSPWWPLGQPPHPHHSGVTEALHTAGLGHGGSGADQGQPPATLSATLCSSRLGCSLGPLRQTVAHSE